MNRSRGPPSLTERQYRKNPGPEPEGGSQARRSFLEYYCRITGMFQAQPVLSRTWKVSRAIKEQLQTKLPAKLSS